MDIEKLGEYIKILTDNYQLKYADANKDSEIGAVISQIQQISNHQQEEIKQIILKEYRHSEILPDTVGSFLFGCLQQTYGDVPVECSPLCSQGIGGGNQFKLQKCEQQIFVQYGEKLNDRFIKLNTCKSKQGYVFVHLDFMGFTLREKEYFEAEGIYKLQILVTKNSKHHTVIKMKDINDLPIIEEYDGLAYITNSSLMEDEKRVDDTSTYIYIILAVVVVSMIAVLYNSR